MFVYVCHTNACVASQEIKTLLIEDFDYGDCSCRLPSGEFSAINSKTRSSQGAPTQKAQAKCVGGNLHYYLPSLPSSVSAYYCWHQPAFAPLLPNAVRILYPLSLSVLLHFSANYHPDLWCNPIHVHAKSDPMEFPGACA